MDILNLDKPLRTAAPLVQVQTGLAAGVYVVDLLIVDAAGVQASAQLTFEVQGRIVRPPIPPIPPVPPVVPPVGPTR